MTKHVVKIFKREIRLPDRDSMLKWLRHYFGGLYDRADRHHIFLNAGGLAFSLFICVIPLVLVLFAVLGTVLDRPTIEQELNTIIDRVIPYETYTAEPKEFIFSRIEKFKSYRRVAGLIGAVGLLFAASSLFSSMRTVLNRIYATDISKHAIIGKLRDFGMVLLVLSYFLVSITVLPGLQIIKSLATKVDVLGFLQLSWVEQIGFFVASFGVMYIAFWVLYYFIPYAKMERRVVAVSAFWAAFLWEIAKQAFGYYITHAVTLSAIYGTYVFFIVVAFWIYYSSMVFILGAEIGQLFRERRDLKRFGEQDATALR